MAMIKEHLTPEELLLAFKYCVGDLGDDSCIGCPNAISGTEDEEGLCKCHVDKNREVIRFLEFYVGGKNDYAEYLRWSTKNCS